MDISDDDELPPGYPGWLSHGIYVEFQNHGVVIGTTTYKEFEQSGETPNLLMSQCIDYWNRKHENIRDSLTAHLIYCTNYPDT